MIRKTVTSGSKKYIYYVCAASKRRECTTHSISEKEIERVVFHAVRDQITLVLNLEKILDYIEKLPSADRKVFNYEAQIAKLEEEIERYRSLKLRLYEDLSDGIIDKAEYAEFRDGYSNLIDQKTDALIRVRQEMKDAAAAGTSERSWVTMFREYENIEKLDRRVLMALADKILIHENHVVEIVFNYQDEYEKALAVAAEYADEISEAV